MGETTHRPAPDLRVPGGTAVKSTRWVSPDSGCHPPTTVQPRTDAHSGHPPADSFRGWRKHVPHMAMAQKAGRRLGRRFLNHGPATRRIDIKSTEGLTEYWRTQDGL